MADAWHGLHYQYDILHCTDVTKTRSFDCVLYFSCASKCKTKIFSRKSVSKILKTKQTPYKIFKFQSCESYFFGTFWFKPHVEIKAEVGSANHKSCAASARATTLKILRRKGFRKPKKLLRRKRKCDVLKSVILIDLLLKMPKARVQNQYSTQIMQAIKIVNKRLLISFEKHKDFKCALLNLLGWRTSLYVTKKYSWHPHLKEPGC